MAKVEYKFVANAKVKFQIAPLARPLTLTLI